MAVLLLKQMCGMSLVSAGGPQWGEASWVLNAPSWKSKPSGVYSVVQVAIQGAGDRKLKPMEKTSPHRTPTVSLGRGWVGVAVYNDFINYVCNHCHYLEMAPHLKRRN